MVGEGVSRRDTWRNSALGRGQPVQRQGELITPHAWGGVPPGIGEGRSGRSDRK